MTVLEFKRKEAITVLDYDDEAKGFTLPEGTLIRECNCGNQTFFITTEGHICATCGTYQFY